jgi:hypothetical protein
MSDEADEARSDEAARLRRRIAAIDGCGRCGGEGCDTCRAEDATETTL